MTIHADPHPQAGTTVEVDVPGVGAGPFRIEDWWDRVYGESWTTSTGNWAALNYGIRAGLSRLDDEVVYGKLDSAGVILHVSELPA